MAFSLKEFIFADLGAAALFRGGEELVKKLLHRGGDAAAEAAAEAAKARVKHAQAIAARRAGFEDQLRSIPLARRRKFMQRYEEAIRTGREDRFIGLVTETEPHSTKGWIPFILWGERVPDEVWGQHLEVLDDNPWEQRWTRFTAWAKAHDAEYADAIRGWRQRQTWFKSGRRSIALASGATFFILVAWAGYVLFFATGK